MKTPIEGLLSSSKKVCTENEEILGNYVDNYKEFLMMTMIAEGDSSKIDEATTALENAQETKCLRLSMYIQKKYPVDNMITFISHVMYRVFLLYLQLLIERTDTIDCAKFKLVTYYQTGIFSKATILLEIIPTPSHRGILYQSERRISWIKIIYPSKPHLTLQSSRRTWKNSKVKLS
ncbi:hypothetical protein [Bariatricus massiliensis]|uniref:hypothetical protein n=1 Tax=Bariatricus massiliensis TaxID=1745713 RepID=UPI001D088445|nr:hypothetical protein [Bariatricus massiliensis]MCB7376899.1 hypothetical protein [Bariatricus massiliensis]MCB7413730.1 hypothetical protein [Bariatricus massiliensis]